MTKTTKPYRRVRIDSFESPLRQKGHGDRAAVLAEIKRDGRFSAFEATDMLMQTLKELVDAGEIEEIPSGYPWHCYRVAKS